MIISHFFIGMLIVAVVGSIISWLCIADSKPETFNEWEAGE